ncbi:neuroligin-1-like [Ischnura elegans]|uniref:neuroligin-1-like n=1 Tax=Ischnura elegans TaxID=197161 RepID=UPI001ED88E59|nr:neuroligin-1-like [Ischnura elegans]
MLSGSAQSLWAVVREPRALRRQVAERLGCLAPTQPHPAFRAPTHPAGPPPAAPQGEDVDVAPCLRRASLHALLASYPPALRFLARFAPATRHDDAGPWLEGPAALHPGPASRTPLLLSVATAEAYAELSAQDVRWGLEEERRDALLRTFVANAYHYHRREILAAVKNEYTEWLGLGADPRARGQRSAKFGDGPPAHPSAPTAAVAAPAARHHLHPITVRDATVEALGDGQTVAPLVAVCREHAGRRGAATYFLHFSHHARDGVDYAQERLGSAPEEVVAHLFGVAVLGGLSPGLLYSTNSPPEVLMNYTRQDVSVAVTMIRYFSNFVKSGDPNWDSQVKRESARGQPWPSGRSESSGHFPAWLPFDLTSQMHLNMGPKPKMRSHYRSHKMALWLNLIPQLHRSQDEDETSPHHEFLEKEAHFYAGAVLNKSIVDPYWRLGAVWSKSALQTAAVPATMECDPSSGEEGGQDGGLSPSSLANPATRNATSRGGEGSSPEDEGSAVGGEDEADYLAALSITVTLGVVLLLLNAAVLIAGVLHHYRQKGREARREHKALKEKASDEGTGSTESDQGSRDTLGVFGDFMDGVSSSKKELVVGEMGAELGLVMPQKKRFPDVMGGHHEGQKTLKSEAAGAAETKALLPPPSPLDFPPTCSTKGPHKAEASSKCAATIVVKPQVSGSWTLPKAKAKSTAQEPYPTATVGVKKRVQILEISV